LTQVLGRVRAADIVESDGCYQLPWPLRDARLRAPGWILEVTRHPTAEWATELARKLMYVIFHERQLRHVLSEYEATTTRTAPSCPEQRSPMEVRESTSSPAGVVRRTEVLGGLTNEYDHAA
jgi:hypothetical protein